MNVQSGITLTIEQICVKFYLINVQSGGKMGVIFKLNPEIRNFILERKRTNTVLSCRGLTTLIEDKFKIKISKSSINSIIKEAGLSLPVGRRLKRRRRKQLASLNLLEFKPIEPIKIIEQPRIEEVGVGAEEPKIEEPIMIEKPVQLDPEMEEKPVEAWLEPECTGAIWLKVADHLIGGSYYIAEAVKNRLKKVYGEIITKTEGAIYLPLFKLEKESPNTDLPGLWGLIGKKIPLENILSYLNFLQSVNTIDVDILGIISNSLQQVRCIKVDLSEENTFYLDGQMHTVWSTPHIPYDFSSTIYNIKKYINTYFYQDKPFNMFMAPGYDTPTKELFNFILSLDSKDKKFSKLTLYGNKLEELEVIPLEKAKRRFFVFGLWPWQFVEYRKVKKIGEFKPFHFEPLNKDFYLAEIEIELSQPVTDQLVMLRGCALKLNLAEKTRLIILSNLPLSNLPSENTGLTELANIYLSHWPNLEEAFQDLSRKIELFTYTGSSQHFLSTESLNFNREKEQNIRALFNNYLKVLDLYVKWHFLPLGYENKDFSVINEHFYSLKANLKKERDSIIITFQPPPGYAYLKELEYACHRINEETIFNFEGKRLWFVLG